MRITIVEIAKIASVSKSAVSLVLNKKPGVSEKTRSKVLAIIKKYNYSPNHIAQSLAARETKSIGLIIKEIDNPFFAKLMKGVYDKCSERGYAVLLGSSELAYEKESEIIAAMVGKRVDGLLITPLACEGSNFPNITSLIYENYPLVVLGGIQNYTNNVVDIDNFSAAYEAMTYLIKLGHTRIALLGGPNSSIHGKKRLEAYKQALIDNNIPVNKNFIIPTVPNATTGFNVGKELFSRTSSLPTAVFCHNDLLAIGLTQALLEMKIKVPETVSVVGFDNIDLSAYNRIPLTTIEMPAYDIGSAAAELLIKQIGSPSAMLHENIILQHKLIVRKSCAKNIHGAV